MRRSLRLAAIGPPLGVLLAFGAVRIVAARLIDVYNASAYAGAMATIAAACAAAGFFPARRAARIDPMAALRTD